MLPEHVYMLQIPSTSKGSPIGLRLDENFSLQQPTWLFTDSHCPKGGLVHLIIGSNCPSPFSYFLHQWPNRKVVGCPVIPSSSPAYILSAYRQRKTSSLDRYYLIRLPPLPS